jgi:hypothetical protein
MNVSAAARPQPSSPLQPARAWPRRIANSGMSGDTHTVELQRARSLHVPLPVKAEPAPIWPLPRRAMTQSRPPT